MLLCMGICELCFDGSKSVEEKEHSLEPVRGRGHENEPPCLCINLGSSRCAENEQPEKTYLSQNLALDKGKKNSLWNLQPKSNPAIG